MKNIPATSAAGASDGTGSSFIQEVQIDMRQHRAHPAAGTDGEISAIAGRGGGALDLQAIRAKTSDIAGLALTHALLLEVGLGTVLEVLHREGLMVRECYIALLYISLWFYLLY